jgi:hypothetical protein
MVSAPEGEFALLENRLYNIMAKCDERQNKMTERFEQQRLEKERWIILAALVSRAKL